MFVRILFVFLLLATSCSREMEIMPPAARRTLLVYLGGDNNLSGEVRQKIDSLTAGWHNTEDNLLIYEDTQGERGTPSLLRVVGDVVHPYTEVVREYPESNSASGEVFETIVQDAITLYPSDSYGLLFFSHGTGWLPEGSYVQPRSMDPSLRSIANDNGREMELADFAAALPDHQFDFIVFEACLMSGVEVAYELRNKADYLVASSAEILSPGFTSIYPALINDLFRQPEADLTGFAQHYYSHCNTLEGAYRSATISVIRLDKIDALANAMRSLYTVQPDVQDISDLQCFDRSEKKLFFDLADFVRQAASINPSTDASINASIPPLLREALVYKASTSHFVNLPIQSHSGLTVYIEQAEYPLLNASWRKTAWYKATHSSIINDK